MAEITSVRQYLSFLVQSRRQLGPGKLPSGFNYWGMDDYVLDRGIDPVSEPLTPEEYKIVFAAVDAYGRRFQMQQCFSNSQMLMLADPSGLIEYREGYASGRAPFPIHHGWATINGKVIDLTWRTETPRKKGRLKDRILGEIPEGWEYVGAPFDRVRVRTRILETEFAGTIIDDWNNNWPCYKEPRLNPSPNPQA